MELEVQDETGASTATVEVGDATFAAPFNESLVHQVVTAYLASARAGTRAQKSRAEVSGGGRKPWRQKGLGRARAGSIRSPLWRGGGVTFAARPTSYAQKVNRKMYRAALRSILSELVRQQRLVVFQEFSIDAPKTRQLAARLQKLGLDNLLIVVDHPGENLQLAVRNLCSVEVCEAARVDPVSLVAFDKVLVSLPALKQLEERLQ